MSCPPTLLAMRLSISILVVLLSVSAAFAFAFATVPRTFSGSGAGAQQPTSECECPGLHPHQHQHPMVLRLPGSSSDIDFAADGSSSRSGRLPVAEDTYGRLVRFAKYASAAYQDLCPRPLGNTLVHSVRAFAAFFLFAFFWGEGWLIYLRGSSRMCSRMRMGSSRVMMDAARSSLCFGGAASSRICSLVG